MKEFGNFSYFGQYWSCRTLKNMTLSLISNLAFYYNRAEILVLPIFIRFLLHFENQFEIQEFELSFSLVHTYPKKLFHTGQIKSKFIGAPCYQACQNNTLRTFYYPDSFSMYKLFSWLNCCFWKWKNGLFSTRLKLDSQNFQFSEARTGFSHRASRNWFYLQKRQVFLFDRWAKLKIFVGKWNSWNKTFNFLGCFFIGYSFSKIKFYFERILTS